MSHRKIPWTKKETEALLHGLKQGLYGNWVAILRLYGARGEISQVLKRRTNVKLKDRPRTLRERYGEKDVPWYLKSTSPDSLDELSDAEDQASDSLSEQDDGCHEARPVPKPLRQTVVLDEFIGHVLDGLCRNFAGPDALLHNDNVNKLLGSAYDFGWDGKVEHMDIDDWVSRKPSFFKQPTIQVRATTPTVKTFSVAAPTSCVQKAVGGTKRQRKLQRRRERRDREQAVLRGNFTANIASP